MVLLMCQSPYLRLTGTFGASGGTTVCSEQGWNRLEAIQNLREAVRSLFFALWIAEKGLKGVQIPFENGSSPINERKFHFKRGLKGV